MNTDRTAITGTEGEDGVRHFAGATANAFARALAYAVGGDIYIAEYGAVFVTWVTPDDSLSVEDSLTIEVDPDGWFYHLQTLAEIERDPDGMQPMSLPEAVALVKAWRGKETEK